MADSVRLEQMHIGVPRRSQEQQQSREEWGILDDFDLIDYLDHGCDCDKENGAISPMMTPKRRELTSSCNTKMTKENETTHTTKRSKQNMTFKTAVPCDYTEPLEYSRFDDENENNLKYDHSDNFFQFARPPRTRTLTFHLWVAVKEIPSHRDNDPDSNGRMYTGVATLHENAKRNRREYSHDQWQWQSATEEDGFLWWLDPVTGSSEFVHPATYALYHEEENRRLEALSMDTYLDDGKYESADDTGAAPSLYPLIGDYDFDDLDVLFGR